MKRTSIRFRLLVLMICLATLPVITVTWIAAINTRKSVEKEIISANNSRILWADQYLNELTRQINSLFYALQTDKHLMNSLSDIESPDANIRFNSQKNIIDSLYSNFYANSRKIDELTLYIHSDRKAFSVSFATSVNISGVNPENGVWSRILAKPVDMYFKQSGNDIYVLHSLNRYQDRSLLGGLSVKINKTVWKEVGDILKSEPESSIFILNDEGDILSGSTMEAGSEIREQFSGLDPEKSDVRFFKTKNYFFFMKPIGDGQLSVIKAIPLATVSRSAYATITAGILTGSIFALASVLLSVLVSLRVSRPIVSLAKTMQTAQIHEFKMKEVRSRDEIGLLEHGYNTMMQRIKELIEGEYRKNIELKNAQLMALQAQINPHFLNNTLHLIGGMALSRNVPEIYQITRTIGELLRYAIYTDGDMVLLQDELKHMQNYIFIQEHRFAGRCTVKTSMDEGTADIKLPKFTLQPIVENAFEHGLQRKEGAWRIDIRIKRIGSRLCITVRDNGVGIGKERLEQIRQELEDISTPNEQLKADNHKKQKGIGLRNVNARLKLQFGSSFGSRIFSREGTGTLVVLILPVSQGGC